LRDGYTLEIINPNNQRFRSSNNIQLTVLKKSSSL
jgi:hypothetical protein